MKDELKPILFFFMVIIVFFATLLAGFFNGVLICYLFGIQDEFFSVMVKGLSVVTFFGILKVILDVESEPQKKP